MSMYTRLKAFTAAIARYFGATRKPSAPIAEIEKAVNDVEKFSRAEIDIMLAELQTQSKVMVSDDGEVYKI